MNNIDNLERLNRLRESGALTEDEFQQEKLKLISGELNDAPKRHFKIALLTAALLASVTALSTFLWINQGPKETATKLEAASTAQPAVQPIQNEPMTNEVSVVKKVEPAPLTFATSTEVLGINPDYLEKRLGVPKKREDGFIVFEVGGCTISYWIDKGSVSKFDVDVSQDCQPTIEGVKVTPQATFGQVLGRDISGEYLAPCLYSCGNAADPIIYLTYPGSRATGFVSVSYATDYDQVDGALDLWEKAVRRKLGLGEFDEPDNYDPFLCASDPPAEVTKLLRKARVRNVSVEQDDPRWC